MVVSTKIGGVPEVLPSHMINYASPEEDGTQVYIINIHTFCTHIVIFIKTIDLVIAVSKAIHTFRFGQIDPSQFNNQLKDMYSWSNVAERTEKVYGSIYQSQNSPLIERLRRYYGCGVYAGKVFCMIVALDYLIWKLLQWIFPDDTIEKAQVFPYKKYRRYFQQDSSPIPYVSRISDIVEEEEYDE